MRAGAPAIWLDGNLHKGTSKRSLTFNNTCLASEEEFLCVSVELWGLSV